MKPEEEIKKKIEIYKRLKIKQDLAAITYHSVSLEGSVLTQEEVRRILKDDSELTPEEIQKTKESDERIEKMLKQ